MWGSTTGHAALSKIHMDDLVLPDSVFATFIFKGIIVCTAWGSETGCLTSLDACNSRASGDVREPISLCHVDR